MRMTRRRVILLWLAICWTVSVSPGQAQEAEKAFYTGKTVRMIVGAGVGGGFHVFSRMIAPYLAETLGATVIVENQPGAGGLVALNRSVRRRLTVCKSRSSNGTMAAFAQLTGDRPRASTLPSSPTCRPWARRPDSGWWGRILPSARSSRRSMPR